MIDYATWTLGDLYMEMERVGGALHDLVRLFEREREPLLLAPAMTNEDRYATKMRAAEQWRLRAEWDELLATRGRLEAEERRRRDGRQ